ncbi:MAG: hypothetical protein FH748_10225 [Balneolaceae bacterium]|nr:hypothetical protein [Balneolaceae bacterium]
MRNSPLNISLFLWVLFLLVRPASVLGFQQAGVIWEVPQTTAEVNAQINRFQELGIKYIELRHPVETELIEQLSAYDFQIYIRSSQQYLSLTDLDERRTQLADFYSDFIARYATFPKVTKIGIFSNSITSDNHLIQSVDVLLNDLAISFNTDTYYYQNNRWWDFEEPGRAFAIFFPDADNEYQPTDLSRLNHLFDSLTESGDASLVFMESSWLLSALENYPELAHSLAYLHQNGDWLLPLPQHQQRSPQTSWTVFFLLAMWIILAVHLWLVPSYRNFINRYFGAHAFWVEDILQFRERSSVSGFILVLQHALFGGMVFYLMVRTFMGPVGVDAFFYHYPLLGITGASYLTFFILGSAIIFLSQLIALAWIYFTTDILHHPSQVLNIYTGVFHLDFVIVTLMVVAFIGSLPWYLIFTCGILYALIWYLAFNVATFDVSQNMIQKRGSYLFYTIGLHFIISVAALMLILVYTDIAEVLKLALSV